MVRFLISTLIYILANGIGLLLAVILLPGFSLSPMAFVAATLLFTVVEVLAGPLLTKIAIKDLPSLSGGVALATTFIGLLICDLVLDGMTIGGVANWLAATLLVWLGALIAEIVLPMYMFKRFLENRGSSA